jgi:hypothetical protein
MKKLSRRAFLQSSLPATLTAATAAAAPPGFVGPPAPLRPGDPPPGELADLRRGPFLQAQSSTRVSVRWRTGPGAEKCLLRYGDSPESLKTIVHAVPVATPFPGVKDWQAVVEGLQPGQTCYYAIEADTALLAGFDDALYFRTAPPPGKARPLRFWVLGDCGTNRANTGAPGKSFAARNGFRRFNKGKHLDGILLLGDNAYSHGTDFQYQNGLFAVYRDELQHTPMWPCLGNHEMSNDYFHIFTTPAEGECGGSASASPNYYSFDQANVHFVVLDLWKAPWRPADCPQRRWLIKDLAATRQDWTVVAFHFAPYCKGKYDSDKIDWLTDVRRKIVPVLEDHGVDLVLTGHDHTYQRSYLLDGHHGVSSTFDPARHTKAPGDGRDKPWIKNHGPHSGMVVVVSGTAGAEDGMPRKPGTGNKLDHAAMVPLPDGQQGGRGVRRLGTFLLEVDGLKLCGTQVDDKSRVIDRFTLEKRR